MYNKKFKFKREINKYKNCLVALSIGSCILLITLTMPESIWQIFLQTISSYIIVSCLLDILKKYSNDEDLIEDISEGIDSEIDAMKFGIKKIDINNERSLSPQKIIGCAKKRIDILHVYGFTWTRDNEEILTNALKSKIKIRVVMADFNNNVTMDFYSNHMNGNVKEKCQKALEKWKEIYNKSCGNLEIYLFDGAITHALHFNEKYGVIKSIPSCKSYSKGTTITIYSKKLDDGVYEKYEREFNQIILESKPYSISENNIS